MASITLSIHEELKERLKHFHWVNWSEIAREEVLKKIIFEQYIATGNITDEAWAFCEGIDWHPIDELPLKETFTREMQKRKKEKHRTIASVADLFKE